MRTVSWNINGKRLVFSLLLSTLFLSFQSNAQPNGEKLYSTCKACHGAPDKGSTGPALKGARERWAAAGIGDMIYTWVKAPEKLYGQGIPYVNELEKYDASQMSGQAVTDEEITAIFDYVDSYVAPVEAAGPAVAATDDASDNSNSWLWWLVIGIVLIVVVFSLVGVVRQLNFANKSAAGEEFDEDESYLQSFRNWAWNNKKLVSIVVLLLFVGGFVDVYGRLMGVGVFENYQPSQPIAFSHKIHAGDNQIDCQYCHNSASRSKHSGIPTVNVCMNCHKGITEGKISGTEEIAKIHDAAGYDAEARQYTGETKPIIWNKVHNLPDHVYFNHSQHVVAGNLDCVNCHGDMRKKTIGQVANTELLNKDISEIDVTNDADKKMLSGRKTIKFEYTKDVLTMGWCIECHGNQDVDMTDSKYYDEIHDRLKADPELYKKIYKDGKVTVKEFGGWECAKCHY